MFKLLLVKLLQMTVPSVDGLRPDMEDQDLTFKRLNSNLDLKKLGEIGSLVTLMSLSRKKSKVSSMNISQDRLPHHNFYRRVIFLNNSLTLANGMNGLPVISQMKKHKMLFRQQTSTLLHILLMVVHTISKRLKSPNNLQTLVNGTNGSLDISLKKKHKMQW